MSLRDICKKFAILELEMTLILVVIKIVIILCIYHAGVSLLTWAKFHGPMTNINGFIHNAMMVIPTHMKWPRKRQNRQWIHCTVSQSVILPEVLATIHQDFGTSHLSCSQARATVSTVNLILCCVVCDSHSELSRRNYHQYSTVKTLQTTVELLQPALARGFS